MGKLCWKRFTNASRSCFSSTPLPKGSILLVFYGGGESIPSKKLGLHYKLREGRKLIHIFTVSTDTLDFKLRLDTEELTCMVEEVTDGLAG